MEARYGAGYNDGMKYSTGSCFNFTVAAGISEVIKIRVGVAGEIDGLNVSNATFRFSYQSEGLDIESAIVEHNVDGCLGLHIPAVGSGEYRYVLDYVDSLGQHGVLLYGRMTSISRVAADELTDKANAAELRVLEVMAGSIHGGPLELRWSASSVAALYAEAAKSAAKDAEAAADAAEGFREDVSAYIQLVQAFMDSFNKALQEAVRVVDNYLYVGGKNTGHYLKGDPGVTPHIGLDGYWYTGTKKLGDRPAFGQDGITPSITPDGYWAFGDWKSTVRAEGRDGLDGTAVRFIIVESVEDIPTEGETCNGGFRYCVPVSSERMHSRSSVLFGESLNQGNYAGDLVFAARRAWNRDVGRLYELSLMSAAESNGEPSEELLYAHIYFREAGDWLYAGCSTEAVAQVAGEWSTWRFDGLCVPAGLDVRVLLSQQSEQVAAEGSVETVRVRVVSTADGSLCGGQQVAAQAQWRYLDESVGFYDVYAWMEDGVGNGVWHLMNRTYDFATSQVYGVMKYATDLVVAGGAPVGRNAEGQACVPIADPALPGAVLPSSTAISTDGGRTHIGSDRKMYVDMSTPSVPGVGKTSYTLTVENTRSVGLTEDGMYAVPRAGAFQWGVVKCGTSVPQSNGMPYILPIGQAADGVLNEYGQDITGQLMMNVLMGGALRTYTKSGWESVAPQGIDTSLIFEESNAFGLVTSVQFTQSAAAGLELLAATNELLAGVYLARDKNDSRDAAVVTPATLRETDDAVRSWVGQNYYTKEQVPTKEMLTNTLFDYVTKLTADATYASKTQLNDLSADVVHKDDPYIPGFIMTEAEYYALGSKVDPNLVYIMV